MLTSISYEHCRLFYMLIQIFAVINLCSCFVIISSKPLVRHSRWNHTRIFSDLGDEDEGDGSDGENGGARTRTSFPASRASLRSSRMRKSFKKSLPEDLLDQSDDDPLDLLDRRKTRSILQSTSKLNKKVETHDDEPEMDDDGRLIVHDDWVKPKQRKNTSVHDSDTKSLAATSRKSGKSSSTSQKKRQKTESGWSYTGVEYTSKKAGGDLKKKDKLEPYAYWPLDRKLLNRRVDRKAVARKGMASVMLTKDLKKLEGKSASRALAGTLKRKRGKK